MWTAINTKKQNKKQNTASKARSLGSNSSFLISWLLFYLCAHFLSNVKAILAYFVQCYHADETRLHMKSAKNNATQLSTGLMLCKNSLSELQLPYIGWCAWQQCIALFTCVCSLRGEKKHCSFNTLGIFSQWEYNFANWNLIEKHLSFLLIHCLSLLPLGSLILSIFFCHNRVCILFWLACNFTSQTVKILPATRKNPGSVPGSSRFPGGGNGYPF